MNPNTRIIIGQRGWVWWCPNGVDVDGDFFSARDAQVIRVWGTTAGLAELLQRGPLPSTILDTPSGLRVHVLAVVAVLSP